MVKGEGNENLYFKNRFVELIRNLKEINKTRIINVIAFNEVRGKQFLLHFMLGARP